MEKEKNKNEQLVNFHINGKLSELSRNWVSGQITKASEDESFFTVYDVFELPDWADDSCSACWGRGIQGKMVEDGLPIVCHCVCEYIDDHSMQWMSEIQKQKDKEKKKDESRESLGDNRQDEHDISGISAVC